MNDCDPELEYLRTPWYYNNEVFTEDMVGKNVGFVYEIQNLIDDRKYIGQKLYTKAKTQTVNGKKKNAEGFQLG